MSQKSLLTQTLRFWFPQIIFHKISKIPFKEPHIINPQILIPPNYFGSPGWGTSIKIWYPCCPKIVQTWTITFFLWPRLSYTKIKSLLLWFSLLCAPTFEVTRWNWGHLLRFALLAKTNELSTKKKKEKEKLLFYHVFKILKWVQTKPQKKKETKNSKGKYKNEKSQIFEKIR